MAELFWAEIVFLPAVEGETLPPELREMVADEEGDIDTTRTAQFLPTRGTKAREEWRLRNSTRDGGGEVTEESPERLVVEMYTKWEPDLEWLAAVAKAFPTVRTVLRGEEKSNPWTVHVGYQGKKTLFKRIESEHDVFNDELRLLLDFWELAPEMYEDRDRMHPSTVTSLLKTPFSSTALLVVLQKRHNLTPKQTSLLGAHRNYVPGFKVDPQAWETYQPAF